MSRTETFDWQGREIAWSRSGSGLAVVFCHGTPFSSVVWEPFAEALSRDFTVYLWDMPGYGKSSKHAGQPVDFGSQADAFAALLEYWELSSPQVIAHDFGGAVSLRAHLYCGAMYSSLMLVDVVAIPPSGSPFFQFVQQNPELLGQLPAYIHAAIVRAYIRNASHIGLRDDALDALVEPWTGAEGQPAFYRQIADYDEQYLQQNMDRLDRMDLPVRIVWGEQDAWIPSERADQLNDHINGSSVAFIPAAGHLVQYDAPVALMDEVRAWLDRRGSGPLR